MDESLHQVLNNFFNTTVTLCCNLFIVEKNAKIWDLVFFVSFNFL